GRSRATDGTNRRLSVGLPLRRGADRISGRARTKDFCPCRSGGSGSRGCAIPGGAHLASGPDRIGNESDSVGALLVPVRRGHQDFNGSSGLNPIEAGTQGASMTLSGAPTTTVISKDSASTREITVAHSPDSDDAFMFYALATNKVRVPGLRFTHTLCDIETLNRKALEGNGVYDVTAISFHAYPYIQDNYALLPSGGSVGDGYGPMIVATHGFSQSEIKRKRIAIPGTLTTAYLALRLFAPGIDTEVVPFDQIIPQVLEGKYEAGLIIH